MKNCFPFYLQRFLSRLLLLLCSYPLWSCRKDIPVLGNGIDNVVVIVVDGPRYSETWGDTSHKYMPNLYGEMASEGVYYSQIYNNGPTYTNAGHTALLTGVYQEIDNTGQETPEHPSVLQYMIQQQNGNSNDAWLFASKDKIAALGNSLHPDWNNQFLPRTDCGISGLSSGYREDQVTVQHVIDSMSSYHPRLVYINLRQPDFNAHYGNWSLYEEGLYSSDENIYEIWQFLKSNSWYANRTALFITNDHGRHLDTVSDGFASHGDTCLGCRHIGFYAWGPGIRKGVVIDKSREQIDVPVTIARIFGFNMIFAQGSPMTELFE